MIVHDSQRIPTLPEMWDTSDKDWIVFGWAEALKGSSIASSVWTIPDGWTSVETWMDQTHEEGGIETPHTNAIELTASAGASGLYLIANTVTFADGRIMERSVRVHVGEL